MKKWLMVCAAVGCATLIAGSCFVLGRLTAAHSTVTGETASKTVTPPAREDTQPTSLYAHNLLLRRGDNFRMYIGWIRGEMVRTDSDRVPSFDVPDSFILRVQKGVASVKLSDLSAFLNGAAPPSSPLKNLSLSEHEGNLKLHGTVHKLISVPVELDGRLSPESDGRIRFHLSKMNVLKLPFKGLLKLFSIKLSDLVPNAGVPGVQVVGNDIFFDAQRLLPAPHIQGVITSVTPSGDALQIMYGGARVDEARLAQWHNFIKLTGGSLNFGKLTMRDVDLTMIDASNDPWFDLDLVHYQAQLVYGTTRMTANAGLEIYMPDVDELPKKQILRGVTTQWLHNKNSASPHF